MEKDRKLPWRLMDWPARGHTEVVDAEGRKIGLFYDLADAELVVELAARAAA